MKLFCDCKTDEEKALFFLSGRAVETGVIAPAISNDVAMAYHRCAEFKKELDALRAKLAEMERQEPVAWRTFDGEGGYDYRNVADNEDYQAVWEARNPSHKGWVEPLYALPGAQAQPAPSFADAYQGAMEEVAIWKKRALEAEDLNRRFVAEINGPVYMGEPAQPAPSVPDVDALAQFIREIDGDNRLGTGALAERIVEWLAAAPEAKCPDQ